MNPSSGVSRFGGDASLLRWLTERCAANLAGDAQAREYLRRNGVSDENVWSAYRIGIGGESLLDELDDAAREHMKALGLLTRNGISLLAPNGLIMPTVDPRQPENPVGLVKQNYAQNQHSFITAPAGLVCAADVTNQARVIITDAPLLALRLAQAGAKGVVIAEVPEVLPPLAEWLAGRELVLTAHKKRGLDAMLAVLGSLNLNAIPAQVQPELWHSTDDALAALGLVRESLKPDEPVPPITPQLLRDLTEYSRARLADGEGQQALQKLGADIPEFVQAYQIGFLPNGFRASLPRESRRALVGNKIGNALLIPAFDESGNVADVLAVNPTPRCHSNVGLMESPQGLLAPRIVTAFDDITITDSFKMTVALFSQEKHNALLIRGLEDARNNAERIAKAGVRSATVACRREAQEIAAVLEAAGIATTLAKVPKSLALEDGNAERETVPDIAAHVETLLPSAALETSTPAAPEILPDVPPVLTYPERPELVEHDRKTEKAKFKTNDATYTVEASIDAGTKLEVRLERGGVVHLDRFDVSVEPQRRRFAVSAAIKTGVRFEDIEGHLVHILDGVRRIQSELLNPAAKSKPVILMNEAEKADALAFLKRPGLLDAIAADLDALGWVGESKTKLLLYLIALSRKLPQPLSGALRSSSGAGKSKGIETVAAFTPAEDLVHVSRMSDSALFYFDRDALHHKLLIVDESDALSRDVLVALRVLQSRGALSHSHVMRDPSTGATATQFVEARGPVAVLTSTAGELDEQVLSRCFEIAVDESPEQTRRIAEAQLRLRADVSFGGAHGRQASIVHRHHSLQRLIESKAVVIPFATRIQFPSSSIKHRRMLEKMLNLIEASALLHQHQRLRHKNSAGEEFIVADGRDYEIAIDLAADAIGRAVDELSVHARDVLSLIQEKKLASFDINELWALKPEWTHHKLRAGLEELAVMDAITSPKRTRPRRYELQAGATAILAAPKVRLLPAAAFGDSGTFGEMGFPVITPKAAMG